MVIITRSAYRRACESSNSSDVSQNNIIPPWCSSGRVNEKRKPRKVPAWEIRSSYPIRENIWEYLHDVNTAKGNRARCNRRQKGGSGKGKTIAVFFAIILLAVGMLASIWMNSPPKTSLLASVIPKEQLISLLGMVQTTSVGEECCHKMRCLAAELSRVEQALRHSEQIRRTMAITSQITRTDYAGSNRRYIEGASVSKGFSTEEYGGQLALWGVVPLWRAAPPPDTVLTLRKPTPSDCWPFRGSHGEILIELPSNTQIGSISLEHIRPDAAKSAPKHFIFYVFLENGTYVKAAEGNYYARGPAKQYYRFNWNLPLNKIIFRVLSNQGNDKYTCLYRVHLYGK
ncbi:unnamed protein product [Chilo suppressalis]|uniref:SUN domain-containing protein n=1 Tax=Chilo suppressalis TaxID=168631 RepID=A0ABN8AQU5_CHISP|nr:unnamed protein product [Chilo suppressalis]